MPRRMASARPFTSAAGRFWFFSPKATSSYTVGMNSWSSGFWNTMPTRPRIRAAWALSSGRPEMTALPPFGNSSAHKRDSSVDFPAPFGPISAVFLPCSRRKFTPASAGVPSG